MKFKSYFVRLVLLAVLLALFVPGIALAASGGGSGTLAAWGDGKGVVQGDGSITARGSGDLWILDSAGDARIYVSGDGTQNQGANGWFHYEGFDGYAFVSGSDVTVVLSGYGIKLYARGTGRFALRGQGHYRTQGTGWHYDPDLAASTPGSILAEQK